MKVWLGPPRQSMFPPRDDKAGAPSSAVVNSRAADVLEAAPRAIALAAPRVAATFLDAAEVKKLYGDLASFLPAELATRLEAPTVDPRWWAGEAPKTVATLPGHDAFQSGSTPWLLASPVPVAEVPEQLGGFVTSVAEGQAWRLGHYPVLADGTQRLGAFVALLPPDFDPQNPAKSIARVVMTVGSGDNRARSALGELAGYSAPGTLFVSFDMQALSVGQITQESAGHAASRQGLAFIRRTLGLSDKVPQYIAGFSAGGAAALVQSFQDFPELSGAAAMAPVIMQWNVHTEEPGVSGTIPPSSGNQFAKTAANGYAPIERTYTVASQVVRSYFTAAQYADLSPHHHLSRGEMPRIPLLITGGTADALAQPVVAGAAALASFNAGYTLPVVFGAEDDQAGRTINIEGFAQLLREKPGMAVVTLQDVGHRLATNVKRPDGKLWRVDMRDLALRFFKALEQPRAAG